MTEMVERIAQAMAKAAAASYYSTSDFGVYAVCEDRTIPIKEMAEAALETMREIPDVAFEHYRCDKTWRELNSTEVLNLWIDAALKD